VYGHVEFVLLDVALAELERVLKRKLGFSQERWQAAEQFLVELAGGRAPSAEVVASVTGDPADDEILASAVRSNVDVLASGDRKHLLPLGEHHGVRILTPQALLAELR
jgi:predicted nucleic acid-binding protein